MTSHFTGSVVGRPNNGVVFDKWANISYVSTDQQVNVTRMKTSVYLYLYL